MRIAIAGNIGAGKTSLTKQLSKSLKYKPYYEDVIANPYLDDFYSHMERWSFNLQIYFLNSRFKQLLDIEKSNEDVIQDRTIYEDAFIFAPNFSAINFASVIISLTIASVPISLQICSKVAQCLKRR